MSKNISKEEVYQRELYKLIFYLQDNDYSDVTRRDMLEGVLTSLSNEGCLLHELHSRGIENVLMKYKNKSCEDMVRTSLESLPTKVDETIGAVNLVFWMDS